MDFNILFDNACNSERRVEGDSLWLLEKTM